MEEQQFAERIKEVMSVTRTFMQTMKVPSSFGDFGMNELLILGFLKNSGDSVSASDIAKDLGITRSAVSQLLAKLERKRLITRRPSEADRKVVKIELTEQARELCAGEWNGTDSLMRKIFDEMGEEDLTALLKLVKKFCDVVVKIKEIEKDA